MTFFTIGPNPIDTVALAKELGFPEFGTAATKNVGQGANDVASAQDARITGAAQTADLGGAAFKAVGTTPGTVADGKVVADLSGVVAGKADLEQAFVFSLLFG